MLTSQVLEVHVALPAGRRDWPQGGVELWYAHHPGHGGGESGAGGSGDSKDSANFFFTKSPWILLLKNVEKAKEHGDAAIH